MRDGRDPDDGERANRVRSLTDVLVGARRASQSSREPAQVTAALQRGHRLRHGRHHGQAAARELRRDEGDGPRDRRADARQRLAVRDRPAGPELRRGRPPRNTSPSGGAEPDAVERRSRVLGIRSEALRHISESTGGFAAVDRNDIGPAFERILEESSEYYVLAYAPSRPPAPGEFRAIDVRVSRPGSARRRPARLRRAAGAASRRPDLSRLPTSRPQACPVDRATAASRPQRSKTPARPVGRRAGRVESAPRQPVAAGRTAASECRPCRSEGAVERPPCGWWSKCSADRWPSRNGVADSRSGSISPCSRSTIKRAPQMAGPRGSTLN